MATGLNERQAQAADLARSTVVTAGAGSGKTRVLVARYLAALATHGFHPERLLAITFTEKAAGEMLGRLREAIAERAASGDRGWRRAREQLGAAPIGTVHALCASLLREHPVAAGVDPDFSVLEETDRRLLCDAVATDDPRQLVDRTQTPGPEHITLDNPEAGNVYWVGSYYASPRGLGPSLPRIRLYAEGALVWEGSRAQDIADQFWEGATIEWPSLAVTETDELFPDYSITDRFGRVRNCPQ